MKHVKSRRAPSTTRARLAVATAAAAAAVAAHTLPAHAAPLTWDPTMVPTAPAGGSGTWDLSTPEWSNGTTDQPWTDTTGTADTAIFGGTTGGTVTLNTSLGALGLNFNLDGYTVATDVNVLTLGTGGITTNYAVGGASTVSGAGVLLLAGNQAWNAATGTTLNVAAPIANAGYTITTAGAGTENLSGALSGTGGLTIAGTGVVTLSGNNSYNGSTAVNSGILVITGRNTSSGDSATTVAAGARLDLQYNNTYTTGSGIVVNGDGTGTGHGLFLKPGITFYTNNLTLQSAPTTLDTDGIGSGATTLRGFDANNVFLNVAATASGSVATSNVNFSTGTYGYTMSVAAGTATATGDFTINGVISGSGSAFNPVVGFTKAGTGSLLLNGANTYASGTNILGGSIILGGDNRLPTATTVVFGGTSTLNLNNHAQTAVGVTVTPNVTGTLANGTLNIGSGSVVFTNTGGGTSNLSGGAISIAGATLDASAAGGNAANGGAIVNVGTQITGTGGLTIKAFGNAADNGGNNGALFNLTNASNNFTGGVTIATGFVNVLGGDGIFGNAAVATTNAVSLAPNAGLILSGGGNVVLNSGIVLSGAGNHYFRQYGNATMTLNSVIGDGGAGASVVKTDAGKLVLTAAETYTGTTTVANGTLILGTSSGTNVGSLPATAAVVVGGATANSAGTFQLGDASNPVNQTVTSLTAAGTSTASAVVGGNAAVSTLTVNDAADDVYTGFLGGGGANNNKLAFVKTGSGTFNVSSAGAVQYSYTGNTTINGGTLLLSDQGSSNGTFASPQIIVNSGGTLALGAADNETLGYGSSTSREALVVNDGTVTILNGHYSDVTLVTMTGGTLNVGNTTGNTASPSAMSFRLQGGITATSDASGTAALITAPLQLGVDNTFMVNKGGMAPASDLTVNSVISGGHALIKAGNGVLTLNANNTFTGTTNVSAGTVIVTGSASLVSPSILVGSGATLQLNTTDTLGAAGGKAALTITDGTVATFGSVHQTLANNLTMTGGTLAAGGSPLFAYAYQFFNGAGLVATSDAAGNPALVTAAVALQPNASGNVTFNVTRGPANPASDAKFTNAIVNQNGGTDSLTKTGNGILTLTGSSTYNGGTNISGGIVQANATANSLGTGTTTVNAGVLAGGTTAVPGATGGPVVISSGGTITAGTGATANDTPGTLNSGSQSWNAGGGYVAKFSSATSGDLLVMSGLTVNATNASSSTVFTVTPVNVQLAAGASIVIAKEGTAATAPGAADPFGPAITAMALVLPTGTTSPVTGDPLSLTSTQDGNGYDLILNDVAAAPEPTSLLLAGLAAAPLALGRRRRKGVVA